MKLVKYAETSKIKLIKEIKTLVEGMNLVQVIYRAMLGTVLYIAFSTINSAHVYVHTKSQISRYSVYLLQYSILNVVFTIIRL